MTRLLIVISIVATMLLVVACSSVNLSELRQEQVQRVIDGDTILLTNNERVRYLDIDTPETVKPNTSVQCYGPESTMRNQELVGGQMVWLDVPAQPNHKDQFGRTLAYVYTDDYFVNAELVKDGYAEANSYGAPGSQFNKLSKLENEAMENKLGRWSKCP